jgi:hypothetical protein
MGRRAKLAEAMRAMEMVRIDRTPKYADRTDGYVVQIGKSWVLIAKIADGGFFDGFEAVRVKDVGRVRRDRSFESVHARTQPEWPPAYPRPIGLNDVRDVLRDLDSSASLIGIQREGKVRSAKWIGRLDEILGKWAYVHEVRPDATWHDAPLGYKLTSITSVEIGSRYLVALGEIGGTEPPSP